MRKSSLINKLLKVLPREGGIRGGYLIDLLRLLPPEENNYFISVGSFFEENDIVCAFVVFYTYNVRNNVLNFEYIRSDTLKPDQRKHLERLFAEVAEKYNKLYCHSRQ
jgi:hypothetical protein